MTETKATIVGIARSLGLSKTTVSDALNGSGRVAPETVELVRSAAADAGYVFNRAARSLRKNRAGAIGVHVAPVARRMDFYMEFTFGAGDAAGAAGFDLTLLTRDPSAAHGFNLDGAIVVDPLPDDRMVRALLDARVPVVTVGRYSGARESDVAGVIEAPHASLQRRVLDDLAASGRSRPVFLGIEETMEVSWAVDARRNFEQWCRGRGLSPSVREVAAEPSARELTEVVQESVRAGSDAIVCCAQGYASQCQLILGGLGLRAGKDIGLVSFAGDRATEIPEPGIAAVDLVPRAYGEAAANLMCEIVERGPGTQLIRTFDGARVVSA